MARRRKLYIVFNEDKRREYLTGFHKRKQERRKKARLENEKKLKEEIRSVKSAYRDEFKRKLEEVSLPNFLADDLNVVSKRTTTDAGEHTVSIEEININQSHYFMGDKKEENKDEPKAKPATDLGHLPLKKALKMNPNKSSWKKKKKKKPSQNSYKKRKNSAKSQKHKS